MSKKPSSGLQPIRREKMPRRNEKCPCGSGKKAKRCCLPKIQALAAIPPEVRQQMLVASILRKPVGDYDTIEVPEQPVIDLAECQATVVNPSENPSENPQNA